MAKKKKSKKQKKSNLGIYIVISVIILASVFLFAGFSGWFKTSNVFVTNVTQNIDEALSQGETSGDCTLQLSHNQICQGEKLTGTLLDGINTNCYLFAYHDGEWGLVYTGSTDNTGTWSKTEEVNVLGKYYFRGVCDNNANGVFDIGADCITNQEYLEIITCPSSDHEDGDIIVEIGEDVNMGEGISEVFKPIDLGDFPYTDGEGCKLQALIETDWHYVDEDKCYGIQGMEGMHFELWDSIGKKWERTDTSPVALGSQTICDLQWNGNPWTFKAQKILNIYQCQIALEYNIKIITCDC